MDLHCADCGVAPLLPDEIAATKKFFGRGVYRYLCIKCLAKQLGTTEDVIRQRIEDFKHEGCRLFF